MKRIYQLIAISYVLTIQFSCQNQSKTNTAGKEPARAQNFPIYRNPPIPPTTQPMLVKTACYKTTQEICAIEVEIMRQTNEYRQSQGKSELRLGEKLSFAARDWSKTQGERRRIGHSGFSRERMSVISSEYGSSGAVEMSAENVAMTSASGSSPERIAGMFVRMWIKSSGHRRNILSKTSTIGVGIFKNNSGSYYATQIFGTESSESTISMSEINPSNLVRTEYNERSNYGLGLYRH